MDENELIRRAKEGDEEAFAELWLRCLEPLRGFIKIATRVPRDEVDGCVNYLYVLVLRRIAHYEEEEEGKFLAYLRETARREQSNYLREGRKRSEWFEPLPEPDGPDSPPQDSNPPHSAPIVARLTAEVLLDAIFSLDRAPHQLVVFGFNRLLRWKPEDIVADLWVCRLRSLLPILAESVFYEYDGKFDIGKSLFPLRHKMDLAVGKVLKNNRARETYKELLPCITGDLRLTDYAAQTKKPKPEDNVATWTNSVIRSVANILEPPCENPPPAGIKA